jgi:hypothetical protein
MVQVLRIWSDGSYLKPLPFFSTLTHPSKKVSVFEAPERLFPDTRHTARTRV